MLKRIKALITAFAVAVCAAVPVSAPVSYAAVMNGKCGDNVTWSYDEAGTLTLSGTGETYDYGMLEVPFGDSYEARRIEIEDGVTGIGNYLFQDFRELESVSIPDSITRIGDHVFRNCDMLKSVSIPKSVNEIEKSAFCDAFALTNFYYGGCRARLRALTEGQGDTFGDPLEYGNYLEYLFGENKDNVTVYYTEEEPTTVIDSGTCGDNAKWELYDEGTLVISGSGDMYDYHIYTPFANEYHSEDSERFPSYYSYRNSTPDERQFPVIRNVIIEDGITSVGNDSFNSFRFLENVTFGKDVASIGEYAFYFTAIENIVIPGNVKTIKPGAFMYSVGRTITLEKGVEKVLYDAFGRSGYTESVTIPNSVTYLDDYAFATFPLVKSVTIPKSVKHIGYQCFSDEIVNPGISGISNVYYEGTEAEWDKIEYSLGEYGAFNGVNVHEGLSMRDYIGIPRNAEIHFGDSDSVTGGGIEIPVTEVKTNGEFDVNVVIPKMPEAADTVQLKVKFDPNIFEVVSWYSNDETSEDCIKNLIPNSRVNHDNKDGYFSLASGTATDLGKLSEGITLTASVKVKPGTKTDSYSFNLEEYSISYYDEDTEENKELWEPEHTEAEISVTNNEISGKITLSGSKSSGTVTVKLIGADGETAGTYVSENGEYVFCDVNDGENYTLSFAGSKCAPRDYPVTCGSEPVTLDTEINLYGDVNSDGEVDSRDATQILRYATGMNSLIMDKDGVKNEYLIKVAHVMQKGKLSAKDATQILRYYARMTSVFDTLQ